MEHCHLIFAVIGSRSIFGVYRSLPAARRLWAAVEHTVPSVRCRIVAFDPHIVPTRPWDWASAGYAAQLHRAADRACNGHYGNCE